jgi:predicted dehydrogenase
VTVRIALAGCGVWGPNLLRALLSNPRAHVVAVADPNPARRGWVRSHVPSVQAVATLQEALSLGIHAAVIASPPSTHAALALDAIDAGADVFVEKPLAMTVADADRCVAAAAARGRVGMVGHLLRYHPAVERLVDLALQGDLGELRHLSASRLSMNGDVSASTLWALGPHDLSVLQALGPSPIAGIEARAVGPDHLVLDARVAAGTTARIELSRSHPIKERRLCVIGSRRTALFDDVRAPDRIAIGEGASVAREIEVPWREPLAVEVDHFLRCVQERSRPLTPLEDGASIVCALARAERSALAHMPVAPGAID